MNKVLIRPLRIEDASISFKWRNNPQIWEYTGNRPDIIITEEIEEKWIEEKLAENNSIRFAITVDDLYVGNIQLTDIIEKKSAEYHIFIGDENYWGKGVAYLATVQILHYAKSILNLTDVNLSVNPENKAAIRVYEKAGFEKINDKIEMKINLLKKTKPQISVFMLAYNHEPYITEALEGILMQKTNYDFIIVIGEDCSQDNTRQIILKYKEKHPGKFELLLHDRNIGAMANHLAVLKACKGKYIAVCEGDDYWTDPYKLQKQVDFLEANLEYSACFHNALIIKSNTESRFFHNKPIKETFEFNEIIKSWLAPSASILFRNNAKILTTFIRFFEFNIISGDRLLHAILGDLGKLRYMHEVMSVYRKHPGGISSWAKHEDIFVSNIILFKQLKKHYKNKYNNALNDQISIWYGMLAVSQINNRHVLKYFRNLMLSLFHIRSFYTLKGWVKLYFLRLK